MVKYMESLSSLAMSRLILGWFPPPAGVFKLNVDASVGLCARQVGLGLVVRDEAGLAMAAGSVKLEAFFNPEVAEAVAIYHEMKQLCDGASDPA
ncbi:hypothetical protein ACOSQ2_008673 [Xanthoceras sorbifolium]